MVEDEQMSASQKIASYTNSLAYETQNFAQQVVQVFVLPTELFKPDHKFRPSPVIDGPVKSGPLILSILICKWTKLSFILQHNQLLKVYLNLSEKHKTI